MPISEERKKLLWEVAREAGLDFLFFQGLPWAKKQFGKPVTAEDRAVVAQAREHVSKGEHHEARKLLVRHMMGWGLYDEQMFDEDLEAVTRAGLASRAQVASLDKWLAANPRRRSRFRNSLTLQATPQARMRVIADYAKMTNAQRLARLKATGKLDKEMDEVIWDWLKANVPGISRQAWDGICQAADAVWNGITGTAVPALGAAAANTSRGIATGARAVGRTAVNLNTEADAWGLHLQAAHPRPAVRPRSGVWMWVKNQIR